MKRSGYAWLFLLIALLLTVIGIWSLKQPQALAVKDIPPLHDVIYGRKLGMALTMEVMLPERPTGIGVIFINSAGFRSDTRWLESGFVEPQQYKAFLKHGQTVFLVTHSAGPKFSAGEIVSDIHRAVRFVRYHARDYNIDPQRLAITGSSSGGYLALVLATGIGRELDSLPHDVPLDMMPEADPVDSTSSAIQAVGVFYAPADLMNFAMDEQTYLDRSPFFVKQAWGLDNKPREEQLAVLRSMSPYEFISQKTPPIILVHGSRDARIPIRQSERLLAKLKANGVPAELIVKEDGNHGWSDMSNEYEQVASWFDKHLSAKKP